MDTGTHLVMGIGLLGLAHLDPLVGLTEGSLMTVALATVIGSQLPDIDTVLRVRGNATYIRHHRGISHSIPALLLYALLLPLTLSFTGALPFTHLLFWSSLAILLHVFTDLLNSYGVQAFRPFTSTWVSYNILPIFDPLLFGLHLIGFLLWIVGFDPGYTFFIIYLFLIPYIGWRGVLKRRIERRLKERGIEGKVILLPTASPLRWDLLNYGEQRIRFGEVKGDDLTISHLIPYPETENNAITASSFYREVSNFLYFSRYPYPVCKEREFGYEVRWLDLRYLSKKSYPLLAVIYLDKDLEKIEAFVGWKQEEKVNEKLETALAEHSL